MEQEIHKKDGILIGIVGPTATGKTAVGIELSRIVDGEIISADSMAVYREMDIGTAKPTKEEQAQTPFHLIDVVDPDEPFSVAEFKHLADKAIVDIMSRRKVPLLVGGTGLYIRAVIGDLNIPSAGPDPELRERLKSEANEFGNQYLLDRLMAVDPETAARLHVNDQKRIIRALEVYELTGKPISHFHETSGSAQVPYDVRLFGLTISRPLLYERIDRRVDEQIAMGLVDEVRRLLEKDYDPDLPSMKGLGYKQVVGYLKGEYSLQEAIDLLKRDTRRFAKRQLTWFRAMPDIHWMDAEVSSAHDIAREIANMLCAGNR